MIIVENFVFVLFDPLKSADPPISSGRFFVIFSKTKAEDCLEAILDFKSKIFFLSDIMWLSKSLGKFPSIILLISSLTF